MTKTILYVIFVASAFLFTWAEFLLTGEFQVSYGFALTHGFVVILLALWWLRLDAEQGHKSGALLKVFVVVLAPLAFAVHLFRTRGFRQGFISVFAMVGLLVLFWGSDALAQYTIQFTQP
jgi:hypothetical protein